MTTQTCEDDAIYEKRKDNLRIFLDHLPTHPCHVRPNFNLCTVCFKINAEVAKGCPVYIDFHQGVLDADRKDTVHVEIARAIDLKREPEEVDVPDEVEEEFPLFEFSTPSVQTYVLEEDIEVEEEVVVEAPAPPPKVKPKKKVKVKKVAKAGPAPAAPTVVKTKKVKRAVKAKPIKKVKKVAKPAEDMGIPDDISDEELERLERQLEEGGPPARETRPAPSPGPPVDAEPETKQLPPPGPKPTFASKPQPEKPPKGTVPPLFATLGKLETKKKDKDPN